MVLGLAPRPASIGTFPPAASTRAIPPSRPANGGASRRACRACLVCCGACAAWSGPSGSPPRTSLGTRTNDRPPFVGVSRRAIVTSAPNDEDHRQRHQGGAEAPLVRRGGGGAEPATRPRRARLPGRTGPGGGRGVLPCRSRYLLPGHGTRRGGRELRALPGGIPLLARSALRLRAHAARRGGRREGGTVRRSARARHVRG